MALSLSFSEPLNRVNLEHSQKRLLHGATRAELLQDFFEVVTEAINERHEVTLLRRLLFKAFLNSYFVLVAHSSSIDL